MAQMESGGIGAGEDEDQDEDDEEEEEDAGNFDWTMKLGDCGADFLSDTADTQSRGRFARDDSLLKQLGKIKAIGGSRSCIRGSFII